MQQELITALSHFDALVSPVAPSTAWKFGEVIDDPLSMYKGDIMTVNLNLAGKILLAFQLHTAVSHVTPIVMDDQTT